ncbi:myb-like protein P [Ochlerotatus camptorhynchus]|uniref:myb-like protein P n=1 Tax=Ochlerotatus camptorhynchus TaxID=644619 RepID=UPI0031E10F9C
MAAKRAIFEAVYNLAAGAALRIRSAGLIEDLNWAYNGLKMTVDAKDTVLGHVTSLQKFVLSLANKKIDNAFAAFRLQVNQFFIRKEEEEQEEEAEGEQEEEAEGEQEEESESESDEEKTKPIMPPKLDLSLAIRVVDKYDGDAATLQSWLDSVQVLREDDPTVPEANFINFLKSRLIGAARGSIDGTQTLADATTALKTKFAIQLTPIAVEAELRALKQKNKTVTDFGSEVEKLATKLASAWVSKGVPFTTEASAKPVVEPIAVQTFINGLKDQSAAYLVKSRNPKTLTAAISDALEVQPHASAESAMWAQGGYQPPFFNRGNRRGNHRGGRGNNYHGNRGGNRNYDGNGRNNRPHQNNNGYRGNQNNQGYRDDHGNNRNQNHNRGGYHGNNNNNSSNNNSNNNSNRRRNANVAEEPQPSQQQQPREEANVGEFFR